MLYAPTCLLVLLSLHISFWRASSECTEPCGGSVQINPDMPYMLKSHGDLAICETSLRCEWILYAPEGYEFEFQQGVFEVDHTAFGPYLANQSVDYLYFSTEVPVSVNVSQFRHLAQGVQYTGNRGPLGVLFPYINKLFATYVTNDRDFHAGFKIPVRAVPTKVPSVPCGWNITIDKDRVPVKYITESDLETNCEWHIVGPHAGQVLIRIEAVYTDPVHSDSGHRKSFVACEEEYLEIQEKDVGIVEAGLAHYADPLLVRNNRICRNETGTVPMYILYSEHITLVFRTNTVGRGFSLTLEPYHACATIFSETGFTGVVMNVVENDEWTQISGIMLPKIGSVKLQPSCTLFHQKANIANETTGNLALPLSTPFFDSDLSCVCHTKKDSRDSLWISLTAGCGVVLVFCTAFGILYRRYKKQKAFENTKTASVKLARRSLGPLYNEYKVHAWNLKAETAVIGSGCYGMVWKGVLTTSHERLRQLSVQSSTASASHAQTTVAIKRMRSHSRATEKEFLEEIEMMAKAGSNINVVQLVGITTDGYIKLVMEYCEQGSLDNYLRTKRSSEEFGSSTEDQILLDYARQICNGMQHLTSRNIIHRDLAARNIMVCQCDILKIADFGRAKLGPVHKEVKNTRSPVAWMAPESILLAEYSHASDVWSFGIVLWEIFTYCEEPYANQLSRPDVQQIMTFLENGLRLKKPEISPAQMYRMMLECWLWRSEERPTFDKLLDALHKLHSEAVQYRYVVVSAEEVGNFSIANM